MSHVNQNKVFDESAFVMKKRGKLNRRVPVVIPLSNALKGTVTMTLYGSHQKSKGGQRKQAIRRKWNEWKKENESKKQMHNDSNDEKVVT
jgi:hypothetical protein